LSIALVNKQKGVFTFPIRTPSTPSFQRLDSERFGYLSHQVSLLGRKPGLHEPALEHIIMYLIKEIKNAERLEGVYHNWNEV